MHQKYQRDTTGIDAAEVDPMGLPPVPDGNLADELLNPEISFGEPETLIQSPKVKRSHATLGRLMMITGGFIVLLLGAYILDLILSTGNVPRGVQVAGIDIGGLSREDAKAALSSKLDLQLVDKPITMKAGDVEVSLIPKESGLTVDLAATLEQAGQQPLDPVTRVESLFSQREVPVVTEANFPQLNRVIAQIAMNKINRLPAEGRIEFHQTTADGPVNATVIDPRPGQSLTDIARAADLVEENWTRSQTVEIPVDRLPVKTTSEGIEKVLRQVVAPAVLTPVQVHAEKKDVVLRPDIISKALIMTPNRAGSLDVSLDNAKLEQVLKPELADTEKESKDAQITLVSGQPSITPSEDSSKVDWATTLTPLLDVLKKSKDRDLKVMYHNEKPTMSTEAMEGLGIKEVVSEFSTGRLSGAAAANVRLAAKQLSGSLVKPGDTFTLNTDFSSYPTAPLNEDGTGPQVPGGGVSQLASTLYNAVYLAGLKDSGHTEHDYYLDRYPVARDVKSLLSNGSGVGYQFTNDAPTGILIQASVSGSTVTVKLWGTKHYRIVSSAGEKTDVVAAPAKTDDSPDCQQTVGVSGFSSTDTRVFYDLSGTEVRRETHQVTYDPRPAVSCQQ